MNKMMKKSEFFACWYNLMEIKSWLKNIEMVMLINGRAYCAWRNLKLAVSHKDINAINWFLNSGKLKVTFW